MPTVRLYGADLFGRSFAQKTIQHLNNAPGGLGGVDDDVQNRLGAEGASEMVDRRHGICCGITLAWIIGFCSGRNDSQSTAGFEEYFMNVLRFQGAYFKDNKGNVSSLDDLEGFYPQGLIKGASGKCTPLTLGTGPSTFPVNRWAAYLGIWHHAIGIGGTQGAWFIVDPNAGLFRYLDVGSFLDDVKQLCEARRIRKGEPSTAKISYTYFTKA
jgi:hypothetical protein